ncbi:MAG: hypothetical protein HY925_03215, partial [Elusimicrobia bacterium]|nr:hypothetical protein [Elusimicrobiota bacterium]
SGYDKTAWKKLSAGEQRAIFEHVGAKPDASIDDLNALSEALRQKLDCDRVTLYSAAKAWADVAARLGLLGAIDDRLKKDLDKHSLTDYTNSDDWAILMGVMHGLEEAGTPDALSTLEAVLKSSDSGVQPVYEQPRFRTPVAWGRIMARHHKLGELTKPRADAQGNALPSKLEEMLTSKNALETAAAIWAIAFSRRDSGVGAPAAPAITGPAPDIAYKEVSSSSSSFGRPWGNRHDYITRRRFGHDPFEPY